MGIAQPSLFHPRAASAAPAASGPRRSLADAEAVLQRVWGYPHFRPAQRRAVLAALIGRDCLAVLPTGGGKSLCYQVPALVHDGLTIVVSPLISLMQDQVNALLARGVAAAFLSSTQTPETRASAWDAAIAGRLKLLYVAPERMSQLSDRLGSSVTLLAVDEAHCISEWGHEFRPHYRALGKERLRLGRPPTIALTATATPDTRRDIVRVLGLKHAVGVLQSFDRPNLHFAVRRAGTLHEQFEIARKALAPFRSESAAGSAIIYVNTRDRTDAITTLLRRAGFSAAPYHAGLPGPARKELLDQFLERRITVMVATNAFGMGIDKPDVRVVLHMGLPARPEAYYQEAGRAGRDGQPAHCELIWTPGDVTLARRMAATGSATKAVRTAARQGLRTMERYLTTRGCRRQVLLGYLGEGRIVCSGCDRCGANNPLTTPRTSP
jgi:ATP-dependent DNA helicase RecQ